jgi:hypothetical protein
VYRFLKGFYLCLSGRGLLMCKDRTNWSETRVARGDYSERPGFDALRMNPDNRYYYFIWFYLTSMFGMVDLSVVD